MSLIGSIFGGGQTTSSPPPSSNPDTSSGGTGSTSATDTGASSGTHAGSGTSGSGAGGSSTGGYANQGSTETQRQQQRAQSTRSEQTSGGQNRELRESTDRAGAQSSRRLDTLDEIDARRPPPRIDAGGTAAAIEAQSQATQDRAAQAQSGPASIQQVIQQIMRQAQLPQAGGAQAQYLNLVS